MKLTPELEEFLNNPQDFEPFLNPNGYIEIPLASNNELHIWSSSIPQPETNTRVHNHNWPHVNKILYGTLWYSQYLTKPYTENTHNLFDFTTLESNGRQIALQECSPQKITGGDILFLLSGRFQYMWSDGPACILVIKVNTRCGTFDPKIASRIDSTPKRKPVKGLHSSAIPLIVSDACERIKKTIGDKDESK